MKPLVQDDHLASVGTAYTVAGHYEQARAPLQRYLNRYPNSLPAHLALVTVYSDMGQDAEARKEAAEVLRLNPKFSLEVHKERMPIKDPVVLERHLNERQNTTQLESLNLGLTLWEREFEGKMDTWLRWTDGHGVLIPTGKERAEQEHQRAERLAALLRQAGIDPEKTE